MCNVNEQYALEKALELAQENIKSAQEWTSPEYVIDFVDKIYSFLVGEGKSKL